MQLYIAWLLLHMYIYILMLMLINSVYFQILGAGQGERYFFNMLEANYRRNKMYRLTSSGYWKVTGKDRPIMINSQLNHPIGIKRVLQFYIGRPTCGSKTNWIMHEYRLMVSSWYMSKQETYRCMFIEQL
jgi:No apical meristem (NAM) protein